MLVIIMNSVREIIYQDYTHDKYKQRKQQAVIDFEFKNFLRYENLYERCEELRG